MNKYTLTEKYLEGITSIDEEFYLQSINPTSFDPNGVPYDYEIVDYYRLATKDKSKKYANRIYFFKKNKNYQWMNMDNWEFMDQIPGKLISDQWYVVGGFMYLGNPHGIRIFFQIKDGVFKSWFTNRSNF